MNRQRQVRRPGRQIKPDIDSDLVNQEPRHVRGGPILSGDATDPKRPPIWRQILRNGLWLVIVAGLIWVMFWSHWLDYRGIEIKGSSTISQADIQQQVDQYMAQRPLDKNILFTNTNNLEIEFKKHYSTIKQLYINRTLFLKLQFNIKESTAALLWQSGGSRWIVAEDGRILRPAEKQETITGTIVDTAQLAVKPGDRVADEQFISFVRAIYDQAKGYGFNVKTTTIESTTRELKVYIDNNIYIRCDTSRGAGEQLKSAQTALATNNKNNTIPKEYIDVRVEGRVFTK